MNAGGKHQAPREAAHALRKEVGQNIKDKKTKELGMETRPGEGAVKKEEFPNRKPSHNWVCGEFWDLRGQHNWEETPPSLRAEGLLFLHGLESNPGSSLQTEEEAGLP